MVVKVEGKVDLETEDEAVTFKWTPLPNEIRSIILSRDLAKPLHPAQISKASISFLTDLYLITDS